MKRTLIFLFGFLPGLLSAQTDTHVVAFALDTFGIDSFYLVARDSAYTSSESRPYTCATNTFFSDTSQFSAYIATVYTEYDALVAQAQVLARRKAEWDYRYQRLVCLRDSVFYGASCSGVGARMALGPPIDETPVMEGFWAVFPTTASAQFLYNLDDVKESAVLLYPNGAQGRLKREKAVEKKKRATKSKKKGK